MKQKIIKKIFLVTLIVAAILLPHEATTLARLTDRFIIDSVWEGQSSKVFQAVLIGTGYYLMRDIGALIFIFYFFETVNKLKPILKTFLSFLLLISFYGYLYYKFQIGDFVFGILIGCVLFFLFSGLKTPENIFWSKSFLVLQVLLAFSWLKYSPFINKFFYSFGTPAEEVSLVAQFYGADTALNWITVIMFFIIMMTALISTFLISIYSTQMEIISRQKENELEVERYRLQVQEARVFQELHSLVHDLKTPLMTIQGLSSLIGLMVDSPKLQEYVQKIEQAVENVNKMISEILYDDVRKTITVEELINYVRAHVFPKYTGQGIFFELLDQKEKLLINHIRVARSLINVIENAFAATANKPDGRVTIKTYKEGNYICFEIADNGVGIPPEIQEEIWTWGFSLKEKKSGLGLPFVKRVVENHNGYIQLHSEVNKGTTVKIFLPLGGYGESTHN
ncbi:HAMP domain-containing sensor histidine kinase [Carboxydothermus hydrogenoformans]|uniref:histidine kinase n=1 Tax=Carboxydothermus hydrogenoformans (strain ATCC BAA-161 / DSM 6008 / Z-2901) TaxID=246194 RepID=Q3AD14_CARHZ|nr:HAMP domain-containing sensor histidine kinase [Carboxydothermus hydrogenoformans]ABB16100.1 sensor histidine kinase [Carboxydothermus hydrogenoformans Z-2901]